MFPARAYAALTGTVDELGKEKPPKEEDVGETGVKEGAQKFSLGEWFCLFFFSTRALQFKV